MYLFDAGLFGAAVAVADGDVHAFADGSAVYATYGYAPGVGAVVEAGDEHLGCALEGLGGGDVLEYLVEEVGDVGGGGAPVGAHPALFG